MGAEEKLRCLFHCRFKQGRQDHGDRLTGTFRSGIHKAPVAADVAAKAAKVDMLEVRIARGLGGKGFLVFTGEVSAVRSAVKACANMMGETGEITSHCVLPAPHADLVKQILAQ